MPKKSPPKTLWTRRQVMKTGGLATAGIALGCEISPGKNSQQTDLGNSSLLSDAGLADPDSGPSDAASNELSHGDVLHDDAGEALDQGQADAGQIVESSSPIVLLQLSDLHVGEEEFAARAFTVAAQQLIPVVNPHLTLLTGDLVDQGDDDAQWTRYTQILSAAGLGAEQIYEQAGNHDAKSDPDLSHFLAHTPTAQAGYGAFGYRDLVV